MKKLILDVDTGIDDAFAIAYALSQTKQVQLIGITTSFGNVSVEQATKNTRQVLELFQANVPVYQGARHHWGSDAYQVPQSIERVHGKNGLGNYCLPEPQTKARALAAEDFLIESAQQYGEELIVVTLGPLTNLANALKKEYDAIQTIGKVVSMAGAVTLPGNVTPFAEANVFNDPLAAKYVLERLDLTLVGLDVTLQTMITQKEITCFDRKTPQGDFLAAIAHYYYHHEYQDQEYGGALHDPLAVGIALYDQFVTDSFHLNLTVDMSKEALGRTTGNLDLLIDDHKRTRLCLGIQATEFVDHFMESLCTMISRNNK